MESLGFPPPCGWVGPGDGLGPDQQVHGEGDDLEPDLVLGEPVEGQVAQAGDFEVADPVLGPGSLAVSDFKVPESPALGVGREAGDPPAVLVGKPQFARHGGGVGGER